VQLLLISAGCTCAVGQEGSNRWDPPCCSIVHKVQLTCSADHTAGIFDATVSAPSVPDGRLQVHMHASVHASCVERVHCMLAGLRVGYEAPACQELILVLLIRWPNRWLWSIKAWEHACFDGHNGRRPSAAVCSAPSAPACGPVAGLFVCTSHGPFWLGRDVVSLSRVLQYHPGSSTAIDLYW
jgi:hypothetical protein